MKTKKSGSSAQARVTAIKCLIVAGMFFSHSVLASSKYFLAGFGSPPAYWQIKYPTAAAACRAMKDSTEATLLGNPNGMGTDPITGTYTFIHWPNENLNPGFDDDCRYSFTGQNASGSTRYIDSQYLGHVLAMGCNANQFFDPDTSQCVDIAYYLGTSSPAQAQCSSCVENFIAHPINPASGAMFDTFSDGPAASGSMPVKRSYNSLDKSSTDSSTGWRHSFTRSVAVRYSTIDSAPYVTAAGVSSKYSSPSTACVGGFAEVKSGVPQWATVSASYANGNCLLTKNGAFVGTVTVRVTGGSVVAPPSPVAYDAIRDDGQLIRFIVDSNGSIINPPGVGLKLQKTAASFTITDGNDNVEQYDTNGKLLTVTSRTGVVQTMSYDGSGRLGSVSDSFGHQLTLSYDAQGYLSSVTR